MTKIIGNAADKEILERQQMAEFARLIRSGDDISCDECGCTNFLNVYKIKKVSGLMSGTGQDMIVPVPIYACADCGHVNKRFLKSVGLESDEEETKQPASDIKIETPDSFKPKTDIKAPEFPESEEGMG